MISKRGTNWVFVIRWKLHKLHFPRTRFETLLAIKEKKKYYGNNYEEFMTTL